MSEELQNSNELPIGTDKNEFFAFNKERSFTTKYLEHNGKRWEFEIYDDISVNEVNDCIAALHDLDELQSNQDVNKLRGLMQKQNYEKYMRRLFRYFIKSAPFEHTKETELIQLQKTQASLCYKIKELLPYDPTDLMMNSDVKKKLRELLGMTT